MGSKAIQERGPGSVAQAQVRPSVPSHRLHEAVQRHTSPSLPADRLEAGRYRTSGGTQGRLWLPQRKSPSKCAWTGAVSGVPVRGGPLLPPAALPGLSDQKGPTHREHGHLPGHWTPAVMEIQGGERVTRWRKPSANRDTGVRARSLGVWWGLQGTGSRYSAIGLRGPNIGPADPRSL